MTKIEPGLTLENLLRHAEKLREIGHHFHWRNSYRNEGVEYVSYQNLARIDEHGFRHEDFRYGPVGPRSNRMYTHNMEYHRITHVYLIRKLSGLQFHVRTYCNDDD